jgi:N-acetylmuramoyl-L-alanine amidase
VKNFKSLDRGVKQAGFLVLYNVTMPGVLVEAGFLSNAKEEELLISEKGRHIISYSIFEAFKAYKESKEGISVNKPNKLIDSIYIDNDNNTLQQDTVKHIDKPIFRVQFMTSSKDMSLKSKEFINIENVWKYNDGNTNKYTTGIYNTFQEANKKQEEMKKKGYKDAFVVVFSKDKRISVSDAKKLLNNN